MTRLDEAAGVSTVQRTGEGQRATAHGRARRASQPIRLIGGAILALTLAIPRPAYALFGEEDWISGQNQTLMALLWEELEHTTQLSTLIANAK
ncbi:MAG: hypothetical protein RIM72_06160, partial [Alphaproteobacteria bacterium]